MNRKSSDDALIGLAEEINAQIKVQRIVFDDRSVNGGSEIVESNLRRPLQVGQNLQTRKRAVLLARVIRRADAAKIRNAIAFIGQTHFFGQRQAGAGHMQQRILLIRIARDAIFAAARWIYEFNFDIRADIIQIPIPPNLKGVC